MHTTTAQARPKVFTRTEDDDSPPRCRALLASQVNCETLEP